MKFSVIIPTFNRPTDLDRCLAALARLDYPRDEFEVIVVDDGGHADLAAVLARHRELIRLTLLRQTNSGPGPARNLGTEHASGAFVAFIDDDCAALPEWLRALEAAVTKSPEALVGGRVINALPDNLNSAASQAITDYLHEHFNRDPERCRFFPSNNIALATASFRKIGGFDPVFARAASEDRDFCDRWLAGGLTLVAAPGAVVLHYRAMSFRGFWKQHFLYGRGAFEFAQARLRRNAGAVPFEGWLFHFDLLTAPIRKSLRPRSFCLSLLIIVSQIAVAFGYAFQARNRQQRGAASSYDLASK